MTEQTEQTRCENGDMALSANVGGPQAIRPTAEQIAASAGASKRLSQASDRGAFNSADDFICG